MSLYRSIAIWPHPAVQLCNTDNSSIDTHSTRGQAEAVCRMLESNGFGGDGLIFPLETRVEEVEDSQ